MCDPFQTDVKYSVDLYFSRLLTWTLEVGDKFQTRCGFDGSFYEIF
jgi:hypothetical protein